MPDANFPNMTERNWRPASDSTAEYNCVAWAAHTTAHYIWPDAGQQFAWPPDLQRQDTVDALCSFFSLLGFSCCQTADPEPGFEKIAVYENDDGPQHVARQLPSGYWTSKMGPGVDAEHTSLDALTGPHYGRVVSIMKRPTDGRPPKLPPLFPPPARLIRPDGRPLVP